MAEKDELETNEIKVNANDAGAPQDSAADLANDPILGGSSINSEDYWFLKLSGMDNK